MTRKHTRVVAAIGSGLTLLLAAPYFGSAFCTLVYGFRLGSQSVECGLASGTLGVAWGAWRPDCVRGFVLTGPRYLFLWSPLVGSGGGSTLRLPLWIPLLGAGVPTVFLIRAARRPNPGCCPSCGYDRTGAASSACPECGATEGTPAA